MYESNHYGSYAWACTRIHTRWSCWAARVHHHCLNSNLLPPHDPNKDTRHTKVLRWRLSWPRPPCEAYRELPAARPVTIWHERRAVELITAADWGDRRDMTVQLAPASTANLAAGDGAAAAPAAAGAQPQIEPGRAGGRICVKPKLVWCTWESGRL